MPPNTFSLTKRYSNLANELGARASEPWAVVRDPKFELGEVRAVQNWVVENVRVITQANELTFSDFSYNSEGYSRQFSVSVDGEALEGHCETISARPSRPPAARRSVPAPCGPRSPPRPSVHQHRWPRSAGPVWP